MCIRDSYSTRFGLKFFSNWGDYTLAVSEDIKQYLIRNYKLEPERILVSINGVDTEKFSMDKSYEGVCEEFGLQPDAKHLVYMSRLNDDVCLPLLRLFDLFEALDRQEPGVELMVIGEGNIMDQLQARAAELNQKLGRKAIVFTGARTDVNRLLSIADGAIGVGRAIMESVAMMKPVIVAGVEGYIGIFGPDKLEIARKTNFTCRGCKEIQPEKYLQDLLAVLRLNQSQRHELGVYGRGIIKKYYSLENMVEDNLALYSLGKKRYRYDAVVLGYYGFKNSGDDALLHAMIQSLREEKPDVSVNVLSLNPRETSEMYGVDATLRYDIFGIFRTLRNSNLFILGGGSLIQDVTSTKSVMYYLWMTWLAKRQNKKVLFYANGIGPLRKESNKKRVRRVLKTVDYITLRDDDSKEVLEQLGIDVSKNVEITADPVFCMREKNDEKAREVLEEAGILEGERMVCISVRKWDHAPENFERLCANLADYLAERYHLLPVFIPMQYPYDASISRNIVAKMKQRGVFIGQRLDIPTMLSVVSRSELVVSVRLHLLIYAAIFSVPAIGIAYDPKVSNLQRFINQPYFLDPRSLIAGDYRGLVDDCMEHHEQIKMQLTETVSKLKEKAHRPAQIAVEMMGEDT